jgi:hypothetical protein
VVFCGRRQVSIYSNNHTMFFANRTLLLLGALIALATARLHEPNRTTLVVELKQSFQQDSTSATRGCKQLDKTGSAKLAR